MAGYFSTDKKRRFLKPSSFYFLTYILLNCSALFLSSSLKFEPIPNPLRDNVTILGSLNRSEISVHITPIANQEKTTVIGNTIPINKPAIDAKMYWEYLSPGIFMQGRYIPKYPNTNLKIKYTGIADNTITAIFI